MLEKNLESYEKYYINYCQILKRGQKLTEIEINELINIKQKTNNKEIQLCCNLLIDSKIEAHVLIKQLDSQTLETFKKYPISIYL